MESSGTTYTLHGWNPLASWEAEDFIENPVVFSPGKALRCTFACNVISLVEFIFSPSSKFFWQPSNVQGTFCQNGCFARGVRSESLEVFYSDQLHRFICFDKDVVGQSTQSPWRVRDLLPLESLLYRMQLLFLWKLPCESRSKIIAASLVRVLGRGRVCLALLGLSGWIFLFSRSIMRSEVLEFPDLSWDGIHHPPPPENHQHPFSKERPSDLEKWVNWILEGVVISSKNTSGYEPGYHD